ncbi:methylated-DNA--[protein]-cysteine S-methyltransferase [Candidatus Parcubacteria bacterium]|nr:MAG: methylated-DNA--[protein]-cysteine S-methyltransferase [Candidatus Parcubacteria bacterium]
MYKSYLKSPLGILEVIAEEKNILEINFVGQIKRQNNNALSKRCVVELKEYFVGQRKIFSVPIKLSGTPWQQKVWLALSRVQYGVTISYADLALMVAGVKAARAVGGAVNKNPLPIIIPCHRVVGSKGDLVGYNGGLWRKKWLLEHENKL